MDLDNVLVTDDKAYATKVKHQLPECTKSCLFGGHPPRWPPVTKTLDPDPDPDPTKMAAITKTVKEGESDAAAAWKKANEPEREEDEVPSPLTQPASTSPRTT